MKFRSQVYTAVSGSIGGITYSHNRGGMYTRGRATPTNPNTAAQQTARSSFTTLASAWSSTLTQTQRDAWEDYAALTPVTDAFGEPLTLSGFQMYTRCNSPRVRTGLPRVDDGPSTAGLPTFTPITSAAVAATPVYNVLYTNTDDWANEDDAALIIQMSRNYPASINYFNGPFQWIVNIDGDSVTAPTSPEAITTNPFGMTASGHAGDVYFLRARVSMADGRLSGVQIYRAIIV